MFIVLLTNLIKTFIINNGSNHVKCESLSNQKCQIEPALINLDPKNTVSNCITIHLQVN